MRWLFAPSLKPFVLLAAAASALLNIAMLMPSLFTLHVFDRVFASRSIETLAMLSALTILALVFAYCMDVARSRALATAGQALQVLLSPAALEQATARAAAGRGRANAERLRDVMLLRNLLEGGGMRALLDAPWLPIYLLVIAVMHPLLGILAGLGAATLVLLAVVTERMTRDGTDAALRQSRAAGRLAESLVRQAELLVGMGMVSHALGAWLGRHQRFLDEHARLGARSARLAALARFARQGVQIAMLATGAWLVVDAGASPGIMVAATILLARALQPVEYLISGWKPLMEARGAWRRLSESDGPAAPERRLRLPAPAGRLELERVVFTHAAAQRPLIKGISFTIEAGESLGIVGASGSGKTTLARLLLGIWHPNAGAVRLDAANITHWDRSELGAHVGYQPQDAALFSGTVAENIARLGPVQDSQVIDAARLAHAHEMILRLPDGYATKVGEDGAALSGGQRQRIALARALYGRPKLVVLDEPDAHLDAEGQEALRNALRALKARGATVVVVGHRAGLIAQLDKVAVIQEGALQAFGPAATVLGTAHATNVHALRAPVQGGEAVA